MKLVNSVRSSLRINIIGSLLVVFIFAISISACDSGSPTATSATNPTSTAGEVIAGSASPTETAQSSGTGSGSNSSGNQSVGPLIAADGTLKTAMQRVVENEGMKFTFQYTSTMGTPDLDFAFKADGITVGRQLPTRKTDFNLAITAGKKGAKQNGEWLVFWDDSGLEYTYVKTGGQWQEVNMGDIHEDPTAFNPLYAYNEINEFTSFGPTSFTGDANPDFISQIAAAYTLSGTEHLRGEDADRYHLVGEAGGVLDIWLSKKSGDILRIQRDVTSNGMGTFGVIDLSEIGQPQTIREPK